jgi:hypothetical protein
VEDGRGRDGTEWAGERQPEKEGCERRPALVENWRYAGEVGEAPVVQGWGWEGTTVLVDGMSGSGERDRGVEDRSGIRLTSINPCRMQMRCGKAGSASHEFSALCMSFVSSLAAGGG